MKKSIVLLFACVLTTAIVFAQSGQKSNKAFSDKKASERERSVGGQRTDNELKDDRKQVKPTNHLQGENDGKTSADTSSLNQTGERRSAQQVATKNDDQPQNNNSEGGSSAQAVVQSTSSESGSPSVLAGKDGKGRDGTNNVQRSTPNMAGARVPGNMNLDRLNRGNKNQNSDSSAVVNQNSRPQSTAPQTKASKQKQGKNSQQGNTKTTGKNNTGDKSQQASENKDSSAKGTDKAKDKREKKSKGKNKEKTGK